MMGMTAWQQKNTPGSTDDRVWLNLDPLADLQDSPTQCFATSRNPLEITALKAFDVDTPLSAVGE